MKVTDNSSLSPHNGPILYRFQTNKRNIQSRVASPNLVGCVIQKLHKKHPSFASTDTYSLSKCSSVSCLESALKNAFVWMWSDGTVMAIGGPLLFQVCKWESIMKHCISKPIQSALWPNPLISPRDVVNESKLIIFGIFSSYECLYISDYSIYIFRVNYLIYQVKQLTVSFTFEVRPGCV